MAMYSKEQEALAHYPVAQLDSALSLPWWGSVGSLSDSNGLLTSTDVKQGKEGLGEGHGKGVETHISVSWEPTMSFDKKNSGDSTKTQQPQPAVGSGGLPDYRTWLEIGYASSLVCARYPYADQSYGLLSAYGPQIEGRVMLPLSLATDEGPIFVNAKQYHGIMRRRQSRAKAELRNSSLRARKPYLHESRHLHAKRRARGAGGRFLNTRALNQIHNMKGHVVGHLTLPTGSQNSEVLQSDSTTLNSKETEVAISASEVSSVFPRGDFGLFQIGTGSDTVFMPPKWVAAGSDRCNLRF